MNPDRVWVGNLVAQCERETTPKAFGAGSVAGAFAPGLDSLPARALARY